MNYSAPYILLIGFYGFMSWWHYAAKEQKHRTWSTVICIIVTLIFWGFRGFIFYDWMSYYPGFLELDITHPFSGYVGTMEPGFALLMTMCKWLVNDFQFFVFLCTLINLSLLSNFILKHFDNFPFGMFLCTCIVGFFLFTDLMRNALSVFIFINAADYIYKRKPTQYFVLCLLALSFHYSSILYFPLYFFAHKNINKWIYSGIFFGGCAIFALKIPIFSSLIELVISFIDADAGNKAYIYLTEVVNKSPGINFVFFEYVLTGSLTILYMKELREQRKEANVYINCLLLFMVMTFYLHEFVTMSFRLSLLFGCGYWIVWNDLIKCFKFENNRKLFIFFIFAYCFLRIYGHTRNIIASYNNILFDTETFQERKSLFNKNYKDR